MTDDILNIEVDGKALEARPGQMLIEVTDANDIYIPRFCYHKKLTVAANCRMCLVEVEKAPKPLPACATPVMDGMKVQTRSKLAIEAQKSVMEFLLINHPLDCPICDQGGECELQDLAIGYGEGVSRYHESKRVVKDKNIGPLIQTDMTRCIHCTRCIRFGEEIAGLREMGATGRGERMEIGTYIEKTVSSELSGNIIDVCPVGALTSKPFRFSARAWEMVQRESIAPHDSVGSNVQLHVKGDRVMRVVPAENEAINEVWISDRDRFSYEGLYSEDRLQTPMIKQNGVWQEADWETALEFVRDNLDKPLLNHGGSQLGGLASPASTLEELYLFQKLLRALGTNNIDSRLRQNDFNQQETDPAFPYLGQSIAALEDLDAVLVIGSNVRKEQPMINHRLRKASLKGADIMMVNSVGYDFNYNISEKIIQSPAELAATLAGIIKAFSEMGIQSADSDIQSLTSSVTVNDSHRAMARKLSDAKNGSVLLGNLATAHNQFSTLKVLALAIARLGNVKFGFISEAANTSGAHLAGVLPHRGTGGEVIDASGLNTDDMLEQSLKVYLLMGIEPELDCWDGHKALQAMQGAEFVVSLTAYESETMKLYADVLLPIALFAETSGTYINVEGQSQSFTGAVPPVGEARPAWKILRVMGNLLNLESFDYNSSEEVRDEVTSVIDNVALGSVGSWTTPESLKNGAGSTEMGSNGSLQRITEVPMCSIDAMSRRAQALQNTDDSKGLIQFNSTLAKKLNVAAGDLVVAEYEDNEYSAPAMINEGVSDDCVLIQAAQLNHYELGAWHGNVSLRKA
jgi:NADH-quinone oxidoreductase subunit G